MTDGAGGPGDPKPKEHLLTVARVRQHPDRADVMFFERARIHRLPLGASGYEDAVRLLREAAATGVPVRVWFTEDHGEVIEGVRIG
jgi:hypothetical protein